VGCTISLVKFHSSTVQIFLVYYSLLMYGNIWNYFCTLNKIMHYLYEYSTVPTLLIISLYLMYNNLINTLQIHFFVCIYNSLLSYSHTVSQLQTKYCINKYMMSIATSFINYVMWIKFCNNKLIFNSLFM
jgi:hypothetical protein